MRVALISTWETDCGIAGYSGKLVPALRDAGIEVDVLSIDRRELAYVTTGEMMAWWDQVAERCSAADAVHIQHEFAFFAGAYGYSASARVFSHFLKQLRSNRVPVLTTFHTEPFFFRASRRANADLPRDALLVAQWWRHVVPRFRRGRSNWAVAHTRTSRRRLIDAGIPSDQVRVITQGITPRPAAGAAERAKAVTELDLPADATVLGIFGFLNEHKGHLTAIEALEHLPGDYHLLIGGTQHPFGGDRTLERILALRDESPSIAERVHLLGRLDDFGMDRFFAAVDICLAPYLPEPTISSSAAITWALASAKPVVATRIPTFMELADTWGAVALVTPEAPRELARLVETIGEDDAYRRELSSSAERYVEASSWDRVAQLHADFYDEVCHGARPQLSSARDASVVTGVRAAGRPVTFVVKAGVGDPIADWIATGRDLTDHTIDLTQRLLTPGTRFVDIGAHLGTFSLPAAAMGCEVLSVEASPTNAGLLRRAAERNGFAKMQVVHAAAGPSDGDLEFTPHGPWGHTTLPSDHAAGVETVQVEQVAIDSLLARMGWQHVDVMKIDTEGAEIGVLAGARALLERTDAPIVVFESNAEMLGHYGSSPEALRQALAALGYYLYFHDHDAGRRLVRVEPETVQTSCVADYVATKRPLSLGGRWKVEEQF